MTRETAHQRWRASAYRPGGGYGDPFFCEWGGVVGDRIRRLRLQRGNSLLDMARAIRKPEGGHYSAGYLSRLERGRAKAPLLVYTTIADELEVEAGVLLGPDTAMLEVTDSERTLLRCFRDLGLSPHDVLTTLITYRPEREGEPPDPVADLAAVIRRLLTPVDLEE